MRQFPSLAQFQDVRDRYPVDPAEVRAALSAIPPSWTVLETSDGGAAFRRGNLLAFISVAKYEDGQLWLHVSVSGLRGRFPEWEELKRVKHDFIGDDRWAYQVFPPIEQYVNDVANVLHLFAPVSRRPALPDFTRGLGVL